MRKKDVFSFVAILCLSVCLPLFAQFTLPHPVISDPSQAHIRVIHVTGHNSWVPTTPDEEITAKEILAYLSTAQEHYTTQRELQGGYPSNLECITILVDFSDGSTRGILLGPIASSPEGDPFFLNCSYPASGNASFFSSFVCALDHPDEIRSFVEELLNLNAI